LTNFEPFGQETLIKTLLQQKKPSIKQGKRDLVLMKRQALALTFILTTANVFPFEPNNPIIIIESPTNSTYNVTSLTLNVTIKTMKTLFEGTDPAQNTTRVVTYSLDGESPKVITEISYDYNTSLGSNVTFTGLAVLPELTDGTHNVTVHAEYDYNPYGIHRESESSVYFLIDTTSPFPNTLVIASVITVAFVGVGLLVYFKKRKR
jgi:hypothetical protein